ncbi:MAG: dicarboxylate/amino acid:cation symporter [Planctomycetes bacterium]|nr:dicarboxylate/amino acid:cation symporter [Planctomycetota bacterium]
MSSSLSKRVLLAAVVGAGLGALAFHFVGPTVGVAADAMSDGQRWLAGLDKYAIGPLGQIFLLLLFMLVAPLLFAALALGIAGLKDLKSLGRLGLKTLAYTVTVSAIAVLLGVTLVQALQPGAGVDPAMRERMLAGAAERAASVTGGGPVKTGVELFVQMVPDNVFKTTANGDYLALMIFALFFGVGMVLVKSPKVDALRDALEGLYEVMMKLIAIVIGFAPIGVFALMFTLTAQLGYEVLSLLAGYVGVVLLGLALHQFVVYSLAVKYLGGMSPLRFFRDVQEAMITAFSTASSNATLPTALRVAEEKLKLPHHVSRFVLTLGSTANQNGTALFEGVTVLFLAQFYGVHLELSQQIMVVAVCVLGGIGTAGVPSGSLPVIALILGMIGVPVEGVGIIVGVNGFLDMCRTTLNVTGDLAAAVVVARGEPFEPGDARP